MNVVIVTHGAFPCEDKIVAGNSVRAYYLAKGLVQHGVSVTYIYPKDLEVRDGKYMGDTGIEIQTYTDKDDLHKVIARANPKIVVVGYWELLSNFHEGYEVPIVADVLAPRLLELLFQKRHDITDVAERMLALYRVADRFLCGSERQKLFMLPWLIMAGFDCRYEIPIDIIPISSSPGRPHKVKADKKDWRIVAGGVSWPWRNQDRYIEAIANALSTEQNMQGELVLLSGSYVHGTLGGAIQEEDNKFQDKGVIVRRPLYPYKKMGEYFSHKCDIGIELSEFNVERVFSSSFRSIEFLRCGLPVICNDSLALAKDINAYDAGWSIQSPREIKSLLAEIAKDPKLYEKKSANAIKLVRQKYDHKKTIKPLLKYLQSPKIPDRGSGSLDRIRMGRQLGELQDRLEKTEKDHGHQLAKIFDSVTYIKSEGDDHLKTSIREKEEKISALSKQIESKNKIVEEKNYLIAEYESITADRDVAIAERDNAIVERTAAIQKLQATTEERDAALLERDAAIRERKAVMKEQNISVQEKMLIIRQRDALVEQRNKAFKDKFSAVTRLVKERDTAIMAASSERNAYIHKLEHRLEHFEQSRSWRMMAPARFVAKQFRKIRDGILGATEVTRQFPENKEVTAKPRFYARGMRLFLEAWRQPVPQSADNLEFSDGTIFPSRDKKGKYIAIVTRKDIFPTNHGAAVKIERTAWGLSHYVDGVFLITGDWARYYIFRNGEMKEGYFPRAARLFAIFSLRAARRLKRRGVPDNESFMYHPVYDWGYFARLFILARRYRISLYQAEFPAYALPCFRVRRLMFNNAKCFLVEHNVEYNRIRDQYLGKENRAYKWLKKKEIAFCQKSDSVIAVSDRDRDTLIRDGVDEDKIHVIPHGVDLQLYSQDYDFDLRAEFGIDKDTAILVYHGIYSYYPNYEAVEVLGKEILPRLESRGTRVKLLAIGPDKPETSPHMDVIFTGAVDNLAPYLKGADIAVVTLQKGGGTRMKILEYFAASVPVISTSRGVEGIPVSDGKELIIRDDFDDIADAIVFLLDDSDHARDIAAAGRAYVENLDWKEITSRYMDLL